MKGDFSRLRFNPKKNYTSVLHQQGRVSLDADANEQCAINEFLRTTETVDVIGIVGGPVHYEGFGITVQGNSIEIGKGRYYVDGLLCENPRVLPYPNQPFLIDPNPTDQQLLTSLNGGSISAIQVYLQVWRRLVTELDDPCLREPAIGQADTTDRLQTVWRVVAQAVTQQQPGGPGGSSSCCDSMLTGSVTHGKRGRLSARTSGGAGDCSCQPTPAAGYRGLENQLYRVEIHQGGDATSATFKWSRENGSVVVTVTGVSGNQVYVDSLGPDANLGFAPGQWVEISDDSNLFGQVPNQPGDLYQIQSVSPETLSVTMTQPVAFVDPTRNARMRRWEQFGTSAQPAGVSLATGTWLDLENGIQVEFGDGHYVSGDYWTIPARTATGDIDWPPCDSDRRTFQPPHYTEIFNAPLACITWNGQQQAPHVQDCRKSFPPLTETGQAACCCTYRVSNGPDGDFTSIQAAIDALPAEGGEVCILPGLYHEHVFILNRRDIVIHGCGCQTRVASPSEVVLLRRAALDTAGAINPIAAVFTIVASQHIVLRSFAVEAADGEAGILIDGTATSLSTNQNASLSRALVRLRGTIDVTIEDMVLTASTLPAILAQRAELLRIDRNRVAMKNVLSQWPAIYASGSEIHIDRNWVGIQSAASDLEWLPPIVTNDLSSATSSTASKTTNVFKGTVSTREFVDSKGLLLSTITVAIHPGGIQIGGPSTDVYVVENEIEGGSRNGITLGSLDVLDANGDSTGQWTGVLITGEGNDCCDTGTLQVTGTISTGTTSTTGTTVVAGGILRDIQIHRNRIRNMGLCGIGPVGFFNLVETLEIISIVDLHISSNAISRSVLRNIADSGAPTGSTNLATTAAFGYGAICIPDVQNLIVRDNTVTDFGAQPGANVCGVFVLHGEMIEIRGNQVVETRDWTKAITDITSSTGVRGGIVILFGTPPTFGQPVDSSLWGYTKSSLVDSTNSISTPVYEPGLPAVRVEQNMVRVPRPYALAIFGLGPFEISNNHLTCGGLVRDTAIKLAQTVLIFNMSTAIETVSAAGLPSNVYVNSQSSATGGVVAGRFQNVSSGAVLFSNNVCQLEATAGGLHEYASIMIYTPDHLTFSNNQTWLDASRFSALTDALLLAGSLSVVGNRFQEAPNSVFFSGLTVGVVNITGQNISTYCLIALGSMLATNNNIALVQGTNSQLCAELWKRIQAGQ